MNGRYGRWTVLANQPGARCLCRCDCGTERSILFRALRAGRSQSCGCIRNERLANRRRTHGESSGAKRSAEYRAWRWMISRCENPKNISYQYYGAIGIKVCQEWRHNFALFLADVGRRPSPKHSLDRIDGRKDYEPGNVRWATAIDQSNNRRNVRRVHYRAEPMTLGQAVRAAGAVVHTSLALSRLKLGWSTERAVELPAGG